MICSQCKRRIASAGTRLCVTCAAVLKARVLEHRLAIAQADLDTVRARKVGTVASKPILQVELDDAAITRCRRCDARFLPRFGHMCRRLRKDTAA